MGATNLGKSLLAADILKRIGAIVGADGYLEVTVEDNEVIDLADFDRRQHAGVILDSVGDAQILKRNRESLQGRAKVSKGAKSATNVYAYSYTFTHRAVIATMDLSAKNIAALQTDHWLSNERNVIRLDLTEEAFIRPAVLPVGGSTVPQVSSPARPVKRAHVAIASPPRHWVSSARTSAGEIASAT